MDYQHSFAISAAGMDVERLRVEVAAANLAHAHTVLEADGSGFQPQRVVARAAPAGAFAALVGDALGLPQADIEPTGQTPRRVHEPGHPMADAKGFVSYPGVDTTTEMMTLMSATRAYEANVVSMNAARSMALKALDIGG